MAKVIFIIVFVERSSSLNRSDNSLYSVAAALAPAVVNSVIFVVAAAIVLIFADFVNFERNSRLFNGWSSFW